MKTARTFGWIALAGMALGAASNAQAQCISGLTGGVRYAYSQNHNFAVQFSLSAWEWDGRVDSGKAQWKGGLSGRALRGGRDLSGECEPEWQCYCNYVTDYQDGEAISEAWSKSSGFEFDDLSDSYSFVQEGDYGYSSAQGASVSLNSTRGHVNANPWSFSFGTESESASVNNESGSRMSSAIGSNIAICFYDCEEDYSYYVGSASGTLQSSEKYTVLLDKAPNDPHLSMSLRLQTGATYSTSFNDAALYGMFCVGQPHVYYAAVPITCIGTPHALSMTTNVKMSVQLVKRNASGAVPTSVIQSWSFTGSYTSTPFAFSSSGYYTLMNNNTGANHTISNSEDFGLPAGTRISESWSGWASMDETIPLDFDIAEQCALIVTRSTTITCP